LREAEPGKALQVSRRESGYPLRKCCAVRRSGGEDWPRQLAVDLAAESRVLGPPELCGRVGDAPRDELQQPVHRELPGVPNLLGALERLQKRVRQQTMPKRRVLPCLFSRRGGRQDQAPTP